MVPLVIRLENHAQSDSNLKLEYLTKLVSTEESNIAKAINHATNEIAGNEKGISHTPLTLVVKKNGAPDLTMIDLPGSQVLVIIALEKELPSMAFSLVAEEVRLES
ncbi:hypothetical protein AgCh_018795 [Apium graveolens]